MRWIWGVILILANLSGGAQEQLPDAPAPRQPDAPTPIPLHASSVNSSSIPGFTFWGNAQCDTKGNLYFRIGDNLNETAILRVSPDGNYHDLYDLPSDYEGKTAYVAFRANASGELSVLVEAKDGLHVFSWKPNSKEPANTTLATPEHISPLNFAVFNSGAVLLTGYYNKDAPEALRGKNYLAEFEPSGRLRINFDRDGPAIDLSGKRPRLDAGATIDERGLLYLVYHDRVLVISETGEVVTELTPQKPSPEFRMTQIQAVKNRVGVWFQKTEPQHPVTLRLALVDSVGGDMLRLYEPDAELGNNAVCFTGDSFVFFRVRDGYVRLLTANAR